MVNYKIDDCGTGIPAHTIESLAKLVLPDMLTYFSTEEGQLEFAAWQHDNSSSK